MQLKDCVAPYVDIILHRGRFWAKSAASGSVRWCCFRSCWTVLSHVMRGRPGCLLQSAGGEANRIIVASALSSMRIICPNRVSRRDWIIAVSLGWFVSLCTVYISIPYKLVPFDAKQHTQTTLVECIDLACVCLRYRPVIMKWWEKCEKINGATLHENTTEHDNSLDCCVSRHLQLEKLHSLQCISHKDLKTTLVAPTTYSNHQTSATHPNFIRGGGSWTTWTLCVTPHLLARYMKWQLK